MELIDKFLNCFSNIEFTVCSEKKKKAHQLSIESVAIGEREINRMLNEAKRNLARIRKLHKSGKASGEEVLDYEWRVHELEEELVKFRESQNFDDLSDLGGETL